MVSILFFGDISGPLGREVVTEHSEELIREYKADFVIANGENATHGRGLSLKHYQELLDAGINLVTMGNHYSACEEILKHNDRYPDMIRPANFSRAVPGAGYKTYALKGGKSLLVINIIGVTALAGLAQNNPFEALEDILQKNSADLTIVDFHAEATGEKLALAKAFDGRVTAIVGTHTHIQTNDSRLLPKGTAYITDVGACCAYDSILGMEPEAVIHRNQTGLPARFTVPRTGRKQLNACHILIGEDSRAVSISPISIVTA